MDIKKIRAIISDMQSEMNRSPHGQTHRQYETFFGMLNMLNRRNFSLLRRFDRQFREREISYWRGHDHVKRLEFFRKGEMIVFQYNSVPQYPQIVPPVAKTVAPAPVAPRPAPAPVAATHPPSPAPPPLSQTAPSRAPALPPLPAPVDAPPPALPPLPAPVPAGTAAAASKHWGTIQVSEGESGIVLYPHQELAFACLDKALGAPVPTHFGGLLVLPTGGGKTLTAAHWIARKVLDRGGKVLWVAHRHELLEQALQTFAIKLPFRDIFSRRPSLDYRLISGMHDRPANVRPGDDLIIAGKDSLSAGFAHLLNNWITGHTGELFLVIDEAHHATAKSYRLLIEKLRNSVASFRMLGLTATPFRTAPGEKPLLKQVFPDDIVFKQDLRSLIRVGILSEPHFEEVATGSNIIDEFELSDAQIRELNSRFGDFNAILGEKIASSIANNRERNMAIVNRYLGHREKYRQTIVFALNIHNAIALNALFLQAGVRSDFVVSTIRDAETGITHPGRDNSGKVAQFRNGALEVLINVNILTEGTDLPNVQSVFLARPTISAILMTQMIGRGLRGPRAGGTKEAYIVSFVDDWQQKVAWVNPEKLYIGENVDFNESSHETKTQLLRLVAIGKMEEFAILNNLIIDPKLRGELEKLSFISRVPVGIYQFRLLSTGPDEPEELLCEILVYDNVLVAYQALLQALPAFFERHGLQDLDALDRQQLDTYSALAEEQFFEDCHRYPAYHIQDIRNLLQYFAMQGDAPPFIPLKDREKYDIDSVAARIAGQSLDDRQQVALINAAWESNETEWQAFFNFDKRSFLTEIMNARKRALFPELYEPERVPEAMESSRDHVGSTLTAL